MQYLSQRLLATKPKRSSGEEASRETVVASQHERILDATEQLIAERGGAGTTIERIAKRSRVSSVSFYDHFSGKEEAFVAAFGRAVADARVRLSEEVPGALPWPEQVREGLRVALAMIAANPERAKMLLVESQRGGATLLVPYEAALDRVVRKLSEGRLLDSAPEDLSDALEEATAGGLAWLLHERLETAGPEGIEAMLPELVDVALAPYLGHAEAQRLATVGGAA